MFLRALMLCALVGVTIATNWQQIVVEYDLPVGPDQTPQPSSYVKVCTLCTSNNPAAPESDSQAKLTSKPLPMSEMRQDLQEYQVTDGGKNFINDSGQRPPHGSHGPLIEPARSKAHQSNHIGMTNIKQRTYLSGHWRPYSVPLPRPMYEMWQDLQAYQITGKNKLHGRPTGQRPRGSHGPLVKPQTLQPLRPYSIPHQPLTPTKKTHKPSRPTHKPLKPTKKPHKPSRPTHKPLKPTKKPHKPNRPTYKPTQKPQTPLRPITSEKPKTTARPASTTLSPSSTTFSPSSTTFSPSSTTFSPSSTTFSPSSTTFSPSSTTLNGISTTFNPDTKPNSITHGPETTVMPEATTPYPNDSTDANTEVQPTGSITESHKILFYPMQLRQNVPRPMYEMWQDLQAYQSTGRPKIPHNSHGPLSEPPQRWAHQPQRPMTNIKPRPALWRPLADQLQAGEKALSFDRQHRAFQQKRLNLSKLAMHLESASRKRTIIGPQESDQKQLHSNEEHGSYCGDAKRPDDVPKIEPPKSNGGSDNTPHA